MKEDFKRFVEYGELDSLVSNFLLELGGSFSDKELLEKFISRLRAGVEISLKERGLIVGDAPFSKNFSELILSVALHVGRSPKRVIESLEVGEQLESAVKRESYVEAILLAIRLGEGLSYKPYPYSALPIYWKDFDPLSGPWPEIEVMFPGTDAGRLVSVIQRGRKVWGEDVVLSPVKASIAQRLKVDFERVVKAFAKLPSDLKRASQLLMIARSATGGDSKLNKKNVSDAEVYSLLSICYAFHGLSDLWKNERSYINGVNNIKCVDAALSSAEFLIDAAENSLAVQLEGVRRADKANKTKFGEAINLAVDIAVDRWDEDLEKGRAPSLIGDVIDDILRVLNADLQAVKLSESPSADTVKGWLVDDPRVCIPVEARRGGRRPKKTPSSV